MWIEFGTIARAHGVHGELRLVPMHPDTELPDGLEHVRLRPRHGEPQVMRLASVRAVHRAYLVTLEGVAGRDAAQAWGGAVLEIEASALPPLDPGEIYLHELVGARALDESGVVVGTVQGLVDNGGQDMLVLEAPGGGERLVPFLDDTLIRFDRAARTAVLRVPAGLWD
jgi:16S rRNA processing protein RimM